MESYKYDVFISYSRRDTNVVEKICKAFDDNKISYFIDRQGIGGGLEFPKVIAEAILSSQIFLFIASENSYKSKFAQSEVVFAFNKKQKSDIIPYIIDDSALPSELELTFSATIWRRKSKHPIETTLVDDVLKRVGKTKIVEEEGKHEGLRSYEKCNVPFTFDVFISYSRKDYVDDAGNVLGNNILSKIKDTLKANGISYWFDEEGIYSGDEFASVLTNAIRISRIFLFISSVNSNQSKWTSNEISTALEFKKPIIPLRLDKSPYNDSVMMKIVSFDYIECKDEEKAMSKLLRAIRHHIPDNKQIDSRLFKIPQSVKGATVIMDIGDKKVEHIMSFESSSLKHKTSDSIINHIHLEEIDDSCDCFRPNDISICVADRKTPIVLLIGPACVGKTMTLVRLARYLSEIGYSVCPDRTFRSVSDQGYNKLCDSFQDLINGAYAAPGTSLLDCLLVKILKEGRNILQIVDFAGEVFMDFDSNMAPSYLYQLLNLDNPIIWVIMIEPYWADMNSRREYVEKIRELKRQYISSKDKTIIIVNKIDKTPFLESKSIIDRKGVFNHIRMEYPGLMEIFLNVSPFFKFFKPYDCTLVPFMSGRYTSRDDGPLLYVPSSKEFPQTLWNELI